MADNLLHLGTDVGMGISKLPNKVFRLYHIPRAGCKREHYGHIHSEALNTCVGHAGSSPHCGHSSHNGHLYVCLSTIVMLCHSPAGRTLVCWYDPSGQVWDVGHVAVYHSGLSWPPCLPCGYSLG